MGFSIFESLNGAVKKRDQIIAVDLGGRSTKAIHVQRRGSGFSLLRYAVVDAPVFEKHLSPEMLAEHLKAVCAALEAKTKNVSIAVGVSESTVRHADMPQIPVEDMRQILKNNTKNYLQQDLPNHVFDCWVPPGSRPAGAEGAKPQAQGAQSPKQKVIVGGARKQLIEDLQSAIRQAGLQAHQVVPGLLSIVNAFELAMPEVYSTKAVALVDVGFKHSSVCLLNHGELVASRVIGIGGDHITRTLAEALHISYAEAEGIKVGMPTEVHSHFEMQLSALGREVRASIDFFEHQQDKPITQVYVSGAAARSEFIIKALEAEVVTPCTAWNPTSGFHLSLPQQQAAELEQVAAQLTVAVGITTTI